MSPLDERAGDGRFGIRGLTAVLGPTNTGKTHFAIERMTAYATGMIGLPLRLLAREVYDKVAAKKGTRAVALVTGEEKIIPPNASYWVCTVEAMPLGVECDFVAIDEVQLAADRERGAVFTSRLLHARGRYETLLLGSDTMKPIIRRLFPDAEFVSRARFSALEYAGHKKVSRLPRRSAIVAFSAESVYSIAELVRRQRGGAAVVLGALSPRTRNAQAELYQSGDVEYLVATDAIGMGLNMDIDVVAFAATRKYDGRSPRNLQPAELAQIAGRAGRHVRDGAFCTTADCPALDEETVHSIEEHQFDPVTALQWRNERLNFASLHSLLRSLEEGPPRDEFVRSRNLDDELALRRLASDHRIADVARGGAALKLLWEVCQTPDFRKVSAEQHARLLSDVYLQLIETGRIDEAWIAREIKKLDRTDGQIDALSNRIAHVRTWTYISHRAGWLERSAYWQDRARQIEDRLSDALHERLIGRFVDRRTSVLLRKLKDDAPLETAVSAEGEVIVEGEFVGRLLGFQFLADPREKGPHAKTVRSAALKALRPEIAARAGQLTNAPRPDFDLRADGTIWWRSAPIASLSKGPLPLRPRVVVSDPDMLATNALARVQERLEDFVSDAIGGALGPLVALHRAVSITGEDAIEGVARGLGYRLVENFGALARAQVADDVKALEQADRARLRNLGVRFGEFNIFLPALLKPAPARMLVLLRALWEDRPPASFSPPPAGHTSAPLDNDAPHALYYAAGFRPSGSRAVRIDMLERLADLVRKEREISGREGFEATPQMMSLVGCSGEDFEAILQSLGFRKNVLTLNASEAVAARAVVSERRSASLGSDRAGRKKAKPGAVSTPSGPAPAQEPAASDGAVDDGGPKTPAEDAATPTLAVFDDGAAAAPHANEAGGPTATLEKGAAQDEAAPAAGERDDAPAEGEPSDATVELVLWRQPPRKPQAARPRRAKSANAGERGEARPSEGERKGRPRGKKPFQGAPRGGPAKDRSDRADRSPAPPKRDGRPHFRKEADPNSPFAVLAALKARGSDQDGDGSE